MKLPCLNNDSVKLIKIDYDVGSQKIVFYFLSGENEKIFSTTAENKGGIKFISSSAELEAFLMSLMDRNPQIIKIFNKIVWDYIEGREVVFPIQLVP
ncbi:hypothetical protein [Franconibacter helveticus]|uniref:hypothetical protein n=1 Tax=Franconibacter helveticus TaxID=357240 RepID=UPI00290AD7ED|nr:hypothetical protein [Franconibacter helveticus]MDU6926910.1 hypothetical protein [Franconibacter helveticus]